MWGGSCVDNFTLEFSDDVDDMRLLCNCGSAGPAGGTGPASGSKVTASGASRSKQTCAKWPQPPFGLLVLPHHGSCRMTEPVVNVSPIRRVQVGRRRESNVVAIVVGVWHHCFLMQLNCAFVRIGLHAGISSPWKPTNCLSRDANGFTFPKQTRLSPHEWKARNCQEKRLQNHTSFGRSTTAPHQWNQKKIKLG